MCGKSPPPSATVYYYYYYYYYYYCQYEMALPWYPINGSSYHMRRKQHIQRDGERP